MEKPTTKGLGAAIKMLYPYAYATYRNTVFHVVGIQELPGIVPDNSASMEIMKKFFMEPELKRKAYEKLRYEMVTAGRQPPEPYREGKTELNVIVPHTIELRLDDSLDVVYCSKCKQLNRLSKLPRSPKGGMPVHRNCPKGFGVYKQAPIFVPQPPDNSTLNLTGRQDHVKMAKISIKQLTCMYLDKNQACNHPNGDGQCVPDFDGQAAYLEINRDRPIAGLRIVNNNCPKHLHNIPKQKLWPPKLGGGNYYRKAFPAPNITTPLYTTVAKASEFHNAEIDEVNSKILDSKRTLFNSKYVDLVETKFSRINVLELNYGARIGGYGNGGYVISWVMGGKKNNVIGRMLDTQGFVIRLKPELYSRIDELFEKPEYQSIKSKFDLKSEQRKYMLDIIAHTLKHAMLILVPQMTGFEDQMFMGAYEILENEQGAMVYLYDNENGGHGGFSTFIREEGKFKHMIETLVSRTLQCPIRKCTHACKYCLFLRRCGRTNNDLNRKLLLDSGIFLEQASSETIDEE